MSEYVKEYNYEQEIDAFDLSGLTGVTNEKRGVAKTDRQREEEAQMADVAAAMGDNSIVQNSQADNEPTVITREMIVRPSKAVIDASLRETFAEFFLRGKKIDKYNVDMMTFCRRVAIAYNILTPKQRAQILCYIIYFKLFTKGKLAPAAKTNLLKIAEDKTVESIRIDKKFPLDYLKPFVSTNSSEEGDAEKFELQSEAPAMSYESILDSVVRANITSNGGNLSNTDSINILDTLLKDVSYFEPESFNTNDVIRFLEFKFVKRPGNKDDLNDTYRVKESPVKDFNPRNILTISNIATFLYETPKKSDVVKEEPVTKSKKKGGKQSNLKNPNGDEDEDHYNQYDAIEESFM